MSIFDFNRDGEVSSSEQAFGLGAILAALSETRDEQNRQKELPTNKANGNQKSLGHFKGAKAIAR